MQVLHPVTLWTACCDAMHTQTQSSQSCPSTVGQGWKHIAPTSNAFERQFDAMLRVVMRGGFHDEVIPPQLGHTIQTIQTISIRTMPGRRKQSSSSSFLEKAPRTQNPSSPQQRSDEVYVSGSLRDHRGASLRKLLRTSRRFSTCPQCTAYAARVPKCSRRTSCSFAMGSIELLADHRHPRLAGRVNSLE